ncbi:MAG: GntR family transcriptional regulator [Hyphomicrobiales bacterium]|nr:GntR family transcriptional regulator [Hyphomicrobiales bacterium]
MTILALRHGLEEKTDATFTQSGAIVREQLHDRLLSELREMIQRGELKAGEKIPERELCERFQVSRTPLREALKVLAFEGFVKLKPNRGAVIAELTLTELAETFPIIAVVEELAGELACKNMPDSEIAMVRKLHDEMAMHFEKREIKPYFDLNQRIHEAIQAGARNDTLYSIYRNIEARVRCARLFVNVSENRWAEAMAEHEIIITALEARDAAALSQILKKHVAGKFNRLQDMFAREGALAADVIDIGD